MSYQQWMKVASEMFPVLIAAIFDVENVFGAGNGPAKKVAVMSLIPPPSLQLDTQLPIYMVANQMIDELVSALNAARLFTPSKVPTKE